jgi:hypothetical protein
MRDLLGRMAAGAVAVCLSVCWAALSGCDGSVVDNAATPSAEVADAPYDDSYFTQSDASGQDTSYLPDPAAEQQQFGGAFVSGNKSKDGGSEVYGHANGMDIRCLANDASKIAGSASDFYFISASVINAAGALRVEGNTFTACNFVSSRSGKKYRFMGWTISKSANPLVTTNPLTLSHSSGTLRAYWATVE